MATLDRKSFLKRGAVSIAALSAASGPFGGFAARAANGPKFARENGGYGPLMDIGEVDTGEVLLRLPAGFEYRLLTEIGDPMTDGFPTPARGDGMAAFSWRGNTRLIRNHEVIFEAPHIGREATAYDRRSGGGTTTLEITRDRKVGGSWISLNGTNFNCAGGATPWGTWISCEETVNGPDANKTFIPGLEVNLEQQHGYLFEVPVSRGPGASFEPEPITAAGRFPHEAVSVDPATGIVYMTEDDFAYASGFFRYVPPNNPFRDKRIMNGGRLQVLGVVPAGAAGPVNVNLSDDGEVGVTYRTAWIDIEDVNPTFPTGIENDPAARWLFQNEAEPKGAALFSRLEGIDYWGGRIYIASTQGGGPFPENAGRAGFGGGWGQVWVYDTRKETLTLLFESPDQETLDLPDNITVSPRRKSVLLCEDSSGANFLRGLTQNGLIFDFAENRFRGNFGDEFAGATFSQDTQTLFVNLQASGATFAIWGPWQRGLL